MEVIHIAPEDNRYTIRERLRRASEKQLLLVLSWEVEKGWSRTLDYEVLLREALRQQLEVAWAVDDPDRRVLPRELGFPVFASEAEAQEYYARVGGFPELRARTSRPTLAPRAPWAEELRPPPLPLPRRRSPWVFALQLLVFFGVLVTLGIFFFYTWPQATITLVPQGATYDRIVIVSVDPTAQDVDLQRNVIPSRRIGDEFEAAAQVATTGRGYAISGRARGRVVLTNLLGQDYRVPEGTIVRTTATSYPVRFETTAEVVIPSFGQADVSVEALEEGPRGNVDAYQINLVEGVVGFAVRATNPQPVSGAASDVIATVTDADRARAWELAAQQVMAQAHDGLQASGYLQPGEFLPRQPLIVQAAPKIAYSNIIGEGSDTLGIALRLLVTGEAVSAADVQAVAYRGLLTTLPAGYTLIDTRFTYGEAAEEDIGPGAFSFYVTAEGYATHRLDSSSIHALIHGKTVAEAQAALAELPLVEPPQIVMNPTWFPFIPRLPMRINIRVAPQGW